MTDIVERLRSPANVFYEYAADNGAFLREAADEIERLRATLDQTRRFALNGEMDTIVSDEIERLREELYECARNLEEQVSASYWHIEQPFDAKTQRRYDRDMARAHKAFAALREEE